MRWFLCVFSLLIVGICFDPSNVVAQTTRTVMIEEFTGTWCGWCPYGADSLAAILKNYSYARGLSYHRTSGSPPDTMETAEGVQFISALNPAYPQAAIDRVLWSGQAKIPISRDIWGSKTIERSQATSPLSIEVKGEYDKFSKVISVNVRLEVLQDIIGQYNLNLIVSEDGINQKQYLYPSNTYIDPYYHQHVVRKMITGAYGKTITTSGYASGKILDTTITYTMKSWWKYNDLHLSVMVGEMSGSSFLPLSQSFQENMNMIFSVTPVRLVTFLAEQEQGGVKLTWRTASESNNYGWEIERSDDTKQWSTVGFVQGHGTTTEQMFYEFRDENLKQNTQYMYRLKQVDADGTSEYSPVARVYTFVTPTSYRVEQNYPNPFGAATMTGAPSTTILYSLPVAEQVSIRVYDNLGRLVKTLIDNVQQPGHLSVGWNGTNETGSQAANGLYYYTITTPHFTATKRMMLLK